MSIFEGLELSEDQEKAIQAKLDTDFVGKSDFDAVNDKRKELLGETKKAKAARDLADEEANAARLAKAAKDGDIESLNSSWQEKLDAVQGQLDARTQQDKQNSINKVAESFVNEHVIEGELVRSAMTSDIAKRLDLSDGKIAVRDTQGNLTALTVEDLFAEIKAASKYKPYLVATKASGGGAGGSSSNSASGAIKTLANAETKEERVAAIKAKREARNS